MLNMRWRRKRRRWLGGMVRRLGGYGQARGTRTHHVTIMILSTGKAEGKGEGREDRAGERARVGREKKREKGEI